MITTYLWCLFQMLIAILIGWLFIYLHIGDGGPAPYYAGFLGAWLLTAAPFWLARRIRERKWERLAARAAKAQGPEIGV